MSRVGLATWGLLLLGGLALPLPVMAEQDDGSLSLAPSSPWVADFAEDSCALRRTFAAGDHTAFLELRKFEPGEEAQIIVTSNLRRRERARVGLNFVPDTETNWHERAMLIDLGDEYGEGFLTNFVPYTADIRQLAADLLETQEVAYQWTQEQREVREAEITGLAVTDGYREDLVLETGPMQQPMSVMRSCLDELLDHWGIDAEAQRSLMRPVRPLEMERWVRRLQERYPSNMLRSGEQAVVRIRLTISKTGAPTDCAIQLPMSNKEFDELACSLLLEHARFEPALSGDGVPVASYWVTSVVYAIN